MTGVIPTEKVLMERARELQGEMLATSSFVQRYRFLNSEAFRKASGVKDVSFTDVMWSEGLVTEENLSTVFYIDRIGVQDRVERIEREFDRLFRRFERLAAYLFEEWDRVEDVARWCEHTRDEMVKSASTSLRFYAVTNPIAASAQQGDEPGVFEFSARRT